MFVLAVSALQLCTSSDRSVQISGSNRSFSICDNRFVLQDGSHRGPVTVASGSMHYSRVPKAYWADRLQRMRALGLNSVQTCRDPTIHSPDGSPCAVQERDEWMRALWAASEEHHDSPVTMQANHLSTQMVMHKRGGLGGRVAMQPSKNGRAGCE